DPCRAPARCRKVPLRLHGVLGLHRLLTVLPYLVRQPPGGVVLVQDAARWVVGVRLAPPHGGTLRRSIFLPDGARRQTKGMDARGRGRVAPRDALRGYLLAGHADAPSRRSPSVSSGCGRVPRRRWLFRDGHELADATSGARPDARPEACRIARVRERLKSNTSAGIAVAPHGEFRVQFAQRSNSCADG